VPKVSVERQDIQVQDELGREPEVVADVEDVRFD